MDVLKKIFTPLFFILLTGLTSFSQSGWNTTYHSNWQASHTTPVYNDIWGYSDSAGREYAIVGSEWGTHFINVSNRDSIYEIQGFIGRNSNATWRDFKTRGKFAYGVSDDVGSSLQIFDLQYLPDSVVKIYDHDSLSRQSHNVHISGDRLYMISNKGNHPVTGTYNNALRVVDISNPYAPFSLGVLNDPTYNSAHDAYIRNDTVFLSVMWSPSRKGLQVLDFTNPSIPVNIGSLTSYPSPGLNHASWGSPDRNTLVMVDETHGSPLKVVNIQNIASMTTLSTMQTFPGSIAHNPFILDTLAVVSHYHDGVQIWNIKNPSTPVLVGYYDTDTTIGGGVNYSGYQGCWGVYPFLPSRNIIASDRRNGLYVFSMDWYTPPPPPPPPDPAAWNMTFHDNWESPIPGARYNDCWGYVDSAGREYGIFGSNKSTHFLDVSNPDSIIHIASFDGRNLNTVWRDFKVWNQYAFGVSDGGGGSLQIFDLQYLPDSVVKIYDEDSLGSSTHNIQMWRSELYMIDNKGSGPGGNYRNPLRVVDVSDPYAPKTIGGLLTQSYNSAHDIYVWHDTVYLSVYGGTTKKGLQVFDFSSPAFPQLIGSLTSYPDDGLNHASWGSPDRQTLVMSDEIHGAALKTVDISDLSNMITLATFQTFPGAIAHNPFIVDTLVFVSYYHDGVQVWSINDPANPLHVGYYDTDTTRGNGSNYSGFEGCWGVYPFFPSGTILASDRDNGLFTITLDGWIPPPTPPLPLGIGSVISDNQLKVFPNPTNGQITLSFNSPVAGELVVEVLNFSGQEVYRIQSAISENLLKINLNELPTGIYLLRARGKGLEETRKIILE
jgi:choice-of-anchor B domain-containing protein